MSSSPIRIEAPAYVPFEPKTDALRARLRGLAASDGEVLAARFHGPLPSGADVENALLYNVDMGGGSFAEAARFGVRFEHNPTPEASGGVRYQYGLEARTAGFTVWEPARPLATVEAPLDGPPSLAAIWWALHELGHIEVDATRGATEPFAISLRLGGPAQSAQPGLVKIVIDGVVCALQSQTDPAGADDLAPIIATSLRVDRERVRDHLLDASRSALGTRVQLAYPRAKGVQWAPDDDYCVAGEVLLEPAADWSLSASVFGLTRA